MKSSTLNPKKCRACRQEFTPIRPMQKACSVACAVDLASQLAARKAAKAKSEERKTVWLAKEKLRTRADHLRQLQAIFNQWVRLRDAGLPCISCGRHHHGQWHAGHYQGVGREPTLRFEPDNVHKQCKPCNADLHGNLIPYRANLIKKIGLERVEWLEGKHPPMKYTVAQICELKSFYRAEVRRMKKEAA